MPTPWLCATEREQRAGEGPGEQLALDGDVDDAGALARGCRPARPRISGMAGEDRLLQRAEQVDRRPWLPVAAQHRNAEHERAAITAVRTQRDRRRGKPRASCQTPERTTTQPEHDRGRAGRDGHGERDLHVADAARAGTPRAAGVGPEAPATTQQTPMTSDDRRRRSTGGAATGGSTTSGRHGTVRQVPLGRRASAALIRSTPSRAAGRRLPARRRSRKMPPDQRRVRR